MVLATCQVRLPYTLVIYLHHFLWLGRRQWHPTPALLPRNPMDGGAWWAAVQGVAKSWTRLSDFTFTFHFHALEKEMATHFSVLAWRISGTGEPGGLLSMGSHRVGHEWSDLAAAAAAAAAMPKVLLPLPFSWLLTILSSLFSLSFTFSAAVLAFANLLDHIKLFQGTYTAEFLYFPVFLLAFS